MTVQNAHKFPKMSVPAKQMPIDIGVIHFVGIGGIGMSGIAEILHNLGYQVSGSDMADNINIQRLKAMGISVTIGQKAQNIADVSVIVKSSAVAMTNPEIIAAKELGIPIVKRSEMLAELTHLKATIAVAGTHGKTTTTSLVGTILQAADLDPTVINGGIINAYGTNAYLGQSEWLVAEADESDGTFIKIPATIGIITNIDPEHLEFWGSYEALKDAFRTFINNLPFYGFAVLCYDNKEVRNLGKSITDRRIMSYSVNGKNADITATNIKNNVSGSEFDIHISQRISAIEGGKTLKNIKLPLPGKHNIANALGAISTAIGLNISDEIIINAFANFSGVKRRFTKVGEVRGITIIDDYGHHPTEIAATLKAAKDIISADNNVIAVVQPHRYSRLESLFTEFCSCFGDADKIIVTDIYSAGEQPIKGVDKQALVDALNKSGAQAFALESDDKLAETINNLAKSGDIVICLGAGSITYMANELPDKMQ